MVRKKMEGDEDQRRRAAHQARRVGQTPSERGETTGGSKQRNHMPTRSSLTHEEKVAPLHRGKQRDPSAEGEERFEPTPVADRTFQGRSQRQLTPRHEKVFQALTNAEQAERNTGGGPVTLEDIAHRAGLSQEDTRLLLHDLVTVHQLVTQLSQPGLAQGYRYEIKSRI